jgi:hypothetical protein
MFAMGVMAGFIALLPLNIWLAYRRGTKEIPHVLPTGEPVGVIGDVLAERNAWYLAVSSFLLFLGAIWLTISKMN